MVVTFFRVASGTASQAAGYIAYGLLAGFLFLERTVT
jgi:hypothetical protein